MGLGRIIPAALAGLAILGFALLTHAGHAQEPLNAFAWPPLSAHNAEPGRAGVPALNWSGTLARDAGSWADARARKGRLEHASSDARHGMGGNLWMGSAGDYSAEDMVGGFVSERDAFRAGTFPHVSRTGNWADVGHYTQLIWPSTQEVGCAISKGETTDVLACRYAPAGNIVGQKIG
jgi:hypothetical protein